MRASGRWNRRRRFSFRPIWLLSSHHRSSATRSSAAHRRWPRRRRHCGPPATSIGRAVFRKCCLGRRPAGPVLFAVVANPAPPAPAPISIGATAWPSSGGKLKNTRPPRLSSAVSPASPEGYPCLCPCRCYRPCWASLGDRSIIIIIICPVWCIRYNPPLRKIPRITSTNAGIVS